MRAVKKIFSFILRAGISIGLLVFLFKVNKINLADVLASLREADKYLLFASFLSFFLVYLICFYRWQMLLIAAKIHVPLKRAVSSYAGGTCFNLILPTGFGGDVVRSFDLARHTSKPKEVVATVLLDRLSGYVGLVVMLGVSVLMGWQFISANKVVLASVIVVPILLCCILLVLFNNYFYSLVNKLLQSPGAGKIREAIKDLHQEIHLFRHHKIALMNSLLFSMMIQAVSAITTFIIALSLGIKINIIYFFLFMPIIGIVTLLPSVGGAGVREWAMVILFSNAGVDKHLATGLSLINFSFILAYGAIGGLIYVFTVRHRRIQHHQPPAIQP